MTLADSNFWLAATLSKHAFHDAARAWLRTESRPADVLFCRSTQQSYLRLLTTAEVMTPYGIAPLSNSRAWATYEGWLADDRVAFVDEPAGLGPAWKRLAGRATASPKLWMDAYLAAFAIRAGARLVTTNQAFRQFQALDLVLLG